VWIIPSRSRPKNIERLIKAYVETCATTPAVLWLDSDDPFFGEYADLKLPHTWMIISVVTRRDTLSEIYNELFEEFPNRDWYGFLADDVVPETMGWDATLVRAASNHAIAYADDGINGEARATHPVVAGDLARKVGWLALPGLHRLYIDTVWMDIGRRLGCLRYLPEVKVTHHHFSNRMALRDAIYRKPMKAEDERIYHDWKGLTT